MRSVRALTAAVLTLTGAAQAVAQPVPAARVNTARPLLVQPDAPPATAPGRPTEVRPIPPRQSFPEPFIYLVGTEIGRDGVSPTRSFVGDGRPDVWFRMFTRNLSRHIGVKSGIYHVETMVLRTKGGHYKQWDTLPNSRWPVLEVVYRGNRINRADGSVNGFSPADHETIDLYVADDGVVPMRHTPMELVMTTLDGVWTMDVNLNNIWDNKPE